MTKSRLQWKAWQLINKVGPDEGMQRLAQRRAKEIQPFAHPVEVGAGEMLLPLFDNDFNLISVGVYRKMSLPQRWFWRLLHRKQRD